MDERSARHRAPVMLQNLAVGARVRLKGNITAAVTGNPRDGSWIYVRYLAHPESPDLEGSEELAFADDVLEELPSD